MSALLTFEQVLESKGKLNYSYFKEPPYHHSTQSKLHTQSTFWLGDNELHLLGAALHDLCRLTEGDALQADVVQRDQATT